MAYRIGSIYRITKIDDPTINYIGSTLLTLQRRWGKHKSKRNCSISKYLNKYGCENFKIVLIKEYLVCDETHLRAFEQLYINKYKLKNCCINEQDALNFLKKEKKKQYYQENIKQRKEINKQYRLKHREQLKAKSKQYHQEHKEQINAKRSEKITCECGCMVSRSEIVRHRRTMKHISLMNSN